MSIRLMTHVWDVPFPTQSQLLVALKLADYANDDGGSIYPSRNRLAELTQSSESTVKNVLRAFRAIGFLQVAKEGGHGPKSTTHYTINLRLLRALSNGDVVIRGNAESLQLEWLEEGAEFDPLDEGSTEGSMVDPLPPLRGQAEHLRGQSERAKGSTGYPQSTNNHQIDSSGARAGACEAGATPTRASRPAPALTIVRDDVQWRAWLDAVDLQTAERIERAGEFTATARWPTEGAKILSIATVPVNITARMLGEKTC